MSPGNDTATRVNRALDYVLAHLDEPLPLEAVAKAAAFSPFHFHRVFKALMGETLASFVKRARLERAIRQMTYAPERSLTEVAHTSGFKSLSDFSRSFRKRFGVPPSAFDVATFRDDGRKQMLDELTGPETRHLLERLPAGENPDGFTVRLVELPPRLVAYRRVSRPFEGTHVVDAAASLVQWAERHGVADGVWLGYMWDDPDVTALESCRYDVGVVVESMPSDDTVGRLELPAMRVAEITIDGAIDVEQRALDWLYGTWLPRSRCVPDEQPCFERWHGRPFADGLERFRLAIQLPVRDA